MTIKYIPKPVPNVEDIKQLISFLNQEFQIISQVIAENNERQSNVLNIEPSKKVEGMIRYADGANWNPGAGRGLYVRSRISAVASDAWMKL